MGAWGGKLYQDDYALDLKETLGVLSKLPVGGDEILDRLTNHSGEFPDINEEDGSTFWLVVADQFEKKGIRGSSVFEKAIDIIEGGIDIQIQADRDMDARDIKLRKTELAKLCDRLKAPKPQRSRTNKRLPPLIAEPGEIYSFPTMNTESANPYMKSWDEEGFEPTGWGALIVFRIGRLYEYFPWICYSPLYVDQDTEPTFESAVASRLIGKDFGFGGNYTFFHIGVPNSRHFKKLPLQLLGKIELDESRCAQLIDPLCTHDYIKDAVHNNRGISTHAFNLPKPGEFRVNGNPLDVGSNVDDFVQ